MSLLNEDRSVLLFIMAERTLDTLLQLVADRRRKEAIQHLRHEADGKTTIDDLVEALCNGGAATDDHPTDRGQLAIQLYHTHLPKLANHGVVAFDPEHQAVRYQPDAQVEAVLDSLPDELSLAHP